MQRAARIAGRTLADLAQAAGRTVPASLHRAKGFIGELAEWHLGVTAGSAPTPDFPTLGIEVKTIPLGDTGRPQESTYVTVVPLTQLAGITWEGSLLRQKLLQVLWVPYEGAPRVPLKDRRIGRPRLWSPTAAEEAGLKADFEELMELIALGEIDAVSAELGNWLQCRPKAAHGRALTAGIGREGREIRTLPRGFYLRPSFTARIFAAALPVPPPLALGPSQGANAAPDGPP
jgi:DNA mismatch repair protein MutH